MSAKNVLIFVGLALLIAAGCFFLFSSREVKQTMPASVEFQTFTGTNPPFNFTFEYPKNWKEQESRYAGKFDMVGVLGAEDEKIKFGPSMFVTKKAFQKETTVENLAEASLRLAKKQSSFKVLSKRNIKVPAGQFYSVDYQYEELLPLALMRRYKTPVRERVLFCIRGGFSYQINFAGTDEQYKIYKPAFDHFLETFRFLD